MSKNTANHLANQPPRGRRAAAYALLAAFLTLSLLGCASKQVKQPETIKEFLSQPRPQ